MHIQKYVNKSGLQKIVGEIVPVRKIGIPAELILVQDIDNDLRPKYETLISACIDTTEINDQSIDNLVKEVRAFDKSFDHLGVSFITKRIKFWLFWTLGDNALPIYDSIMANEVMRLNAVNAKHLGEF